MKLTIFGASGGVGRQLVTQAVERGHQVRAIYRDYVATPLPAPHETLVVTDVWDADEVSRAVEGAEAVASCLGLRRKHPRNPWSKLTSPAELNMRFAPVLVDAMWKHGVGRVVAVSAAGVGDSSRQVAWPLRTLFSNSTIAIAYADLAEMERGLARSRLDWCAVRPTTLTDGPLTRQVRPADHYGVKNSISRADVAWYMLERLESPGPLDGRVMITGK